MEYSPTATGASNKKRQKIPPTPYIYFLQKDLAFSLDPWYNTLKSNIQSDDGNPSRAEITYFQRETVWCEVLKASVSRITFRSRFPEDGKIRLRRERRDAPDTAQVFYKASAFEHSEEPFREDGFEYHKVVPRK